MGWIVGSGVVGLVCRALDCLGMGVIEGMVDVKRYRVCVCV